MKKLAVITATRAEYGLLMPVIIELRKFETNSIVIELVVTGTHLSHEYGYTVDEIRASGVRIDHIIKTSTASESAIDIANNQAETLTKFTSFFDEEQYNAVVILGDRYEMLSVAIAAGNTHTPIFHLCGGDTTEGAIDEWIRHSISKMSYLHFVTNTKSRKRVIQLGENPERVFNYGSTSIDNILKKATMPRLEALQTLCMEDKPYAICTYHPVTMESGSVESEINEFLEAIQEFKDIEFIITKSNADQGGSKINRLLDAASEKFDNIHVFSSLGVVRYLSLMKYALFVIGNSSSGIIETPAFGIPTVNIGDRQRGRLQSESIINCAADKVSIVNAIKNALDIPFRNMCKTIVSPYGDGKAAEKIAAKMIAVVKSGNIDLKKKFYNLSEEK